jgi:hypothetical protein
LRADASGLRRAHPSAEDTDAHRARWSAEDADPRRAHWSAEVRPPRPKLGIEAGRSTRVAIRRAAEPRPERASALPCARRRTTSISKAKSISHSKAKRRRASMGPRASRAQSDRRRSARRCAPMPRVSAARTQAPRTRFPTAHIGAPRTRIPAARLREPRTRPPPRTLERRGSASEAEARHRGRTIDARLDSTRCRAALGARLGAPLSAAEDDVDLEGEIDLALEGETPPRVHGTACVPRAVRPTSKCAPLRADAPGFHRAHPSAKVADPSRAHRSAEVRPPRPNLGIEAGRSTRVAIRRAAEPRSERASALPCARRRRRRLRT